MQKKIIIFVIACICLLIITSFLGIYYFEYTRFEEEYGTPRTIHDVDEEKRPKRPYTYIKAISSSNIRSVEDMFIPKFFNNDNITLYFPEGEVYLYFIVNRPGDPAGHLTIFRSNGSVLDFQEWESVSEGAKGGRGLCAGLYDFKGGNLTFNLSGSGIINFFSESISDMFQDSPDFSNTVESGMIAFCLPWELTADLPWDRRIVAEASPINGSYFRVLYYGECLHFLGEAKGYKKVKTQIPSGSSWMVFVIVESEEGVSFRFSYSDPIQVEQDPTGICLLGSFILSLIGLIILMVMTVRIFKKQKSQEKPRRRKIKKEE